MKPIQIQIILILEIEKKKINVLCSRTVYWRTELAIIYNSMPPTNLYTYINLYVCFVCFIIPFSFFEIIGTFVCFTLKIKALSVFPFL